MKQLRSPFQKEWRRAIYRTKELPLSFGLSLFLHFLLLIGAKWFLNPRENSAHLRLKAVAFDFALGQAEASNQMTTPKTPRLKGGRPVSHVSQSIAPQEQMPPAKLAEATPVSSFAPKIFRAPAAGIGAELFKAAPAFETMRRLPSTANLAPKLIPHQFALAPPQRKAILKKVTEVIAKTIAPTKSDSFFVWEKNGQRLQFSLSYLPASSATGLDELLVAVTTVDGDDTLSTQLRMRRTAFSHFAQFVDYWDPQVALHDDEFDGRFHSNSAMVISGSGGTQPRFRGKVTTAAYSIRRPEQFAYLNDSKVFLAGIEHGAASIPLPRVFLGIPRDTSRSAGRMHVLAEESWITFLGDGSYSWRTASSPSVERHAKFSEASHTIIGRGKAKLHVKGAVKGMALIYSEDDIIIDGDLLYAADPEVFPNSGDFLGLVSAKDIEIAPPAVTGPGDLKIQAAILAKGRFRVPQLYTRETGTLHIYGSLAAGSITATEPRYGTRIRFDKRFEKMRPPNFPMTDQYEIAEWDEQWIVK
jgi:hypothetical protein